MRCGCLRGHALPALVAVLLTAGAVSAHEIWLTTVHEGSSEMRALVHYGPPGDRRPPIKAKLFAFALLGNDQAGRSLLPGLKSDVHEGLPVLVSAPFAPPRDTGTWLLVARYDHGYWVKTSAGLRNTSKRQVPDAEASRLVIKFAKAFVHTGSGDASAFQKVLGHQLELVPLSNPFALKPKEALKVRVLFDGTPLAGAAVKMDDGVTLRAEKEIPRYTTDASGVAEVLMGQPGLQLLGVEHEIPSTHPDLCDREQYNASVSFLLPSSPMP